jgi:hypothetical protein
MQISIHKLRDRKQVISQLIHKSDIIQGEVIIYLDDAGRTLLSYHPQKPHIPCVIGGVRLENHFLFSVMCHEQPESMSHLSSRPSSSTYIG